MAGRPKGAGQKVPSDVPIVDFKPVQGSPTEGLKDGYDGNAAVESAVSPAQMGLGRRPSMRRVAELGPDLADHEAWTWKRVYGPAADLVRAERNRPRQVKALTGSTGVWTVERLIEIISQAPPEGAPVVLSVDISGGTAELPDEDAKASDEPAGDLDLQVRIQPSEVSLSAPDPYLDAAQRFVTMVNEGLGCPALSLPAYGLFSDIPGTRPTAAHLRFMPPVSGPNGYTDPTSDVDLLVACAPLFASRCDRDCERVLLYSRHPVEEPYFGGPPRNEPYAVVRRPKAMPEPVGDVLTADVATLGNPMTGVGLMSRLAKDRLCAGPELRAEAGALLRRQCQFQSPRRVVNNICVYEANHRPVVGAVFAFYAQAGLFAGPKVPDDGTRGCLTPAPDGTQEAPPRASSVLGLAADRATPIHFEGQLGASRLSEAQAYVLQRLFPAGEALERFLRQVVVASDPETFLLQYAAANHQIWGAKDALERLWALTAVAFKSGEAAGIEAAKRLLYEPWHWSEQETEVLRGAFIDAAVSRLNARARPGRFDGPRWRDALYNVAMNPAWLSNPPWVKQPVPASALADAILKKQLYPELFASGGRPRSETVTAANARRVDDGALVATLLHHILGSSDRLLEALSQPEGRSSPVAGMAGIEETLPFQLALDRGDPCLASFPRKQLSTVALRRILERHSGSPVVVRAAPSERYVRDCALALLAAPDLDRAGALSVIHCIARDTALWPEALPLDLANLWAPVLTALTECLQGPLGPALLQENAGRDIITQLHAGLCALCIEPQVGGRQEPQVGRLRELCFFLRRQQAASVRQFHRNGAMASVYETEILWAPLPLSPYAEDVFFFDAALGTAASADPSFLAEKPSLFDPLIRLFAHRDAEGQIALVPALDVLPAAVLQQCLAGTPPGERLRLHQEAIDKGCRRVRKCLYDQLIGIDRETDLRLCCSELRAPPANLPDDRSAIVREALLMVVGEANADCLHDLATRELFATYVCREPELLAGVPPKYLIKLADSICETLDTHSAPALVEAVAKIVETPNSIQRARIRERLDLFGARCLEELQRTLLAPTVDAMALRTRLWDLVTATGGDRNQPAMQALLAHDLIGRGPGYPFASNLVGLCKAAGVEAPTAAVALRLFAAAPKLLGRITFEHLRGWGAEIEDASKCLEALPPACFEHPGDLEAFRRGFQATLEAQLAVRNPTATNRAVASAALDCMLIISRGQLEKDDAYACLGAAAAGGWAYADGATALERCRHAAGLKATPLRLLRTALADPACLAKFDLTAFAAQVGTEPVEPLLRDLAKKAGRQGREALVDALRAFAAAELHKLRQRVRGRGRLELPECETACAPAALDCCQTEELQSDAFRLTVLLLSEAQPNSEVLRYFLARHPVAELGAFIIEHSSDATKIQWCALEAAGIDVRELLDLVLEDPSGALFAAIAVQHAKAVTSGLAQDELDLPRVTRQIHVALRTMRYCDAFTLELTRTAMHRPDLAANLELVEAFVGRAVSKGKDGLRKRDFTALCTLIDAAGEGEASELKLVAECLRRFHANPDQSRRLRECLKQRNSDAAAAIRNLCVVPEPQVQKIPAKAQGKVKSVPPPATQKRVTPKAEPARGYPKAARKTPQLRGLDRLAAALIDGSLTAKDEAELQTALEGACTGPTLTGEDLLALRLADQLNRKTMRTTLAAAVELGLGLVDLEDPDGLGAGLVELLSGLKRKPPVASQSAASALTAEALLVRVLAGDKRAAAHWLALRLLVAGELDTLQSRAVATVTLRACAQGKAHEVWKRLEVMLPGRRCLDAMASAMRETDWTAQDILCAGALRLLAFKPGIVSSAHAATLLKNRSFLAQTVGGDLEAWLRRVLAVAKHAKVAPKDDGAYTCSLLTASAGAVSRAPEAADRRKFVVALWSEVSGAKKVPLNVDVVMVLSCCLAEARRAEKVEAEAANPLTEVIACVVPQQSAFVAGLPDNWYNVGEDCGEAKILAMTSLMAAGHPEVMNLHFHPNSDSAGLRWRLESMDDFRALAERHFDAKSARHLVPTIVSRLLDAIARMNEAEVSRVYLQESVQVDARIVFERLLLLTARLLMGDPPSAAVEILETSLAGLFTGEEAAPFAAQLSLALDDVSSSVIPKCGTRLARSEQVALKCVTRLAPNVVTEVVDAFDEGGEEAVSTVERWPNVACAVARRRARVGLIMERLPQKIQELLSVLKVVRARVSSGIAPRLNEVDLLHTALEFGLAIGAETIEDAGDFAEAIFVIAGQLRECTEADLGPVEARVRSFVREALAWLAQEVEAPAASQVGAAADRAVGLLAVEDPARTVEAALALCPTRSGLVRAALEAALDQTGTTDDLEACVELQPSFVVLVAYAMATETPARSVALGEAFERVYSDWPHAQDALAILAEPITTAVADTQENAVGALAGPMEKYVRAYLIGRDRFTEAALDVIACAHVQCVEHTADTPNRRRLLRAVFHALDGLSQHEEARKTVRGVVLLVGGHTTLLDIPPECGRPTYARRLNSLRDAICSGAVVSERDCSLMDLALTAIEEDPGPQADSDEATLRRDLVTAVWAFAARADASASATERLERCITVLQRHDDHRGVPQAMARAAIGEAMLRQVTHLGMAATLDTGLRFQAFAAATATLRQHARPLNLVGGLLTRLPPELLALAALELMRQAPELGAELAQLLATTAVTMDGEPGAPMLFALFLCIAKGEQTEDTNALAQAVVTGFQQAPTVIRCGFLQLLESWAAIDRSFASPRAAVEGLMEAVLPDVLRQCQRSMLKSDDPSLTLLVQQMVLTAPGFVTVAVLQFAEKEPTRLKAIRRMLRILVENHHPSTDAVLQQLQLLEAFENLKTQCL